jgi:hypothetical protein
MLHHHQPRRTMTRGKLRRTPRRGLVVAAVVVAAVAPAGGALAGHGQGHHASAVVEWNATAGAAAQAACLSPSNDPLHEARMYAITHIAVHDALNAIHRRYQPYAFSRRAPRHTSIPAAVAAAAHKALVATLADLPTELFPAESGCAKAGIDLVDAAYVNAVAAIPNGASKTNGISIGEAAAAAIVAVRVGDHANDAPLVDTSARGGPPGVYQFTPGTPFAFAPKWGSVTPFTLRDSTQFASGPPYPLTSRQYARDFNEVKRLGGGGEGDPTPSARTAEQTEIARFWVESSPLAWNRMARGIVTDRRLDEWEAARLFGLLNMAMVDGYIGTFQEKYIYNFWRPVTAIHRAAEDGNPLTSPDPLWQPLVQTPPIPDHDSGHSVEGGVAAEVMRRVLGTDRVSFAVCSLTLPAGQTCADPKPVTRSFDRLSAAATENGESRILVGFHFRHAVTDGLAHGKKIGSWAVRNFMEPVHN